MPRAHQLLLHQECEYRPRTLGPADSGLQQQRYHLSYPGGRVTCRSFWIGVLVLLLAGCQRQQAAAPKVTSVPPARVDAARIIGADREPQNWLAHGRTYSEQRYSPLDSINMANVGELGLA